MVKSLAFNQANCSLCIQTNKRAMGLSRGHPIVPTLGKVMDRSGAPKVSASHLNTPTLGKVMTRLDKLMGHIGQPTTPTLKMRKSKLHGWQCHGLSAGHPTTPTLEKVPNCPSMPKVSVGHPTMPNLVKVMDYSDELTGRTRSLDHTNPKST